MVEKLRRHWSTLLSRCHQWVAESLTHFQPIRSRRHSTKWRSRKCWVHLELQQQPSTVSATSSSTMWTNNAATILRVATGLDSSWKKCPFSRSWKVLEKKQNRAMKVVEFHVKGTWTSLSFSTFIVVISTITQCNNVAVSASLLMTHSPTL